MNNSERTRVVVLGASNVARTLSPISNVARKLYGSPIDLYFACALGRSYSVRTQLFIHSVPGILESGLFESLSKGSSTSLAIISDVGNDIFYGLSNKRIVDSIRSVIGKLLERNFKIVLTELPLEPSENLSPLIFYTMKLLLFPYCRLGLKEVVERGKDLNLRLLELASEFELSTYKFEKNWYGKDPIHFKLSHSEEAWTKCMSLLGESIPNEFNRATIGQKSYLNSRTHASRRLIFWERTVKQPCGELADGTKVHFY